MSDFLFVVFLSEVEFKLIAFCLPPVECLLLFLNFLIPIE